MSHASNLGLIEINLPAGSSRFGGFLEISLFSSSGNRYFCRSQASASPLSHDSGVTAPFSASFPSASNQSINQSTNQSTNQPTNQSNNRPTNQPTNQPTDIGFTRPTTQTASSSYPIVIMTTIIIMELGPTEELLLSCSPRRHPGQRLPTVLC